MSRLHEQLYNEVFEAILTGKIRPGTRLTESELESIYDVSRSVIRRTLQRMADEGLVDIRQNKGARVNQVDSAMARSIFDARRIVETGIVELLCGKLTALQMQQLRDLCIAENSAMTEGHRARGLRLSAEFHLMLAHATNNPLLQQYATNLMSRSALAIACLEKSNPAYCAYDEHSKLLDALESLNVDVAMQLMRDHINHIESNLEFLGEHPSSLSSMLGDSIAAHIN